MNIRPATADDLPAITALHLASWQRHYRGIFPDAYLDHEAPEYLRDLWTPARLDTFMVFLARDGDRIAGFIDCNPGHADGPFTESFHVADDLRGQGIGRRLLAALAQALVRQGHRSLFCYVLEDNAPSRAAYARLGATEGALQTFDAGGQSIAERTIIWPDVTALLQSPPKNRNPGDDPA